MSHIPFKIHFNVIHLRLVLPDGFFPLGFPTKFLYAFLNFRTRVTFPAYLIPIALLIFCVS
jgi:hypothetical protein